MATGTSPIRVSEKCYKMLKSHAKAEHRSIAGHAEFLIDIGQAALDNPDLPARFIKEILIARQEEPLVGEDIREW